MFRHPAEELVAGRLAPLALQPGRDLELELLAEQSGPLRPTASASIARASWVGPEPPEPHSKPVGEWLRMSVLGGSVLLTNNLAFSRWAQIPEDPMTTAAAVDRPVHYSAILELNVSSYRPETAQTAKKGSAGPTAEKT